MLTSIEGTYKNGLIELKEKPVGIDHAAVVVTFLKSAATTPTHERMTFGMFGADGKVNDEDFASAEWRMPDDY